VPAPIAWAITPATASNINDAIGLAEGTFSTCAMLRDTTVRCWGQNESGELGDGTRDASAVPVEVQNLTGAVAVTANASTHAGCATCYGYSCALLSDGGTVRCWGENMDGELGNGQTTYSSTPVEVSNLSGVVSLTAGEGNVFAVLSDGTIAGWGINSTGQLGPVPDVDGGPMSDQTQPVRVQMLDHVTAVCGGAQHVCALLSDGGVQCWGDNSYGQLGNGQYTASPTPIAVTW
jgi:hypothetical protein